MRAQQAVGFEQGFKSLLRPPGADGVVLRIVPRNPLPEHQALGLLLLGLGYVLVCAAGFTFTYRNWKRDKSTLLAEVRRLKRELDADHATASGEVNL